MQTALRPKRSPRYRVLCTGSSNPVRATPDRRPPSAALHAAPSSFSANYLLIYLYVHGGLREIYGTGRRPIFVSLERSTSSPIHPPRDRLKLWFICPPRVRHGKRAATRNEIIPRVQRRNSRTPPSVGREDVINSG